MASSSSIAALNERLRNVAGRGNCEEIEQLLRLGASFEPDQYGRTALHYAAHYGQVKAIKLIAARGCDLDTEDTHGCTPLHKAVAPDGHVEAVRALLEEGCAVDRQDQNGNTGLHEAAWHGFSQTVDILIRIGKANIHASNENGQKPIHLACQNGHNQTTRTLLKSGTHPNIKNNSNETPLHIACLFGHMTCARILLSAECDANAKNKDGSTPLHLAASLGKQKITKLLIEAQCDAKIRNKNNQTALDLARQNDHTDVVLLIVGAHRMKKGKLPFFRKKKEGKKLDFDDSFHSSDHPQHHHHHHHHQQGHGSHHKHDDKHRHEGKKRGDDDVDGGQGGLRVRGRRELEGADRHSSGSSKDRSKKRRDKHQDDVDGRSHGLFVKDEVKKKVKSEKKHQEEIQTGREMGNPMYINQPFKDKNGKIIHVPMPVQCNCTPYIKKLENQVEASKEHLLHEIDLSKARFESRMNNMEKRMSHQSQCMDQLCKERIAAERTDCIHRLDQRTAQERERQAAEQDARGRVLRRELKDWFESRIQPLHEQLSRTYLDDTALVGASSLTTNRRGRPRAGMYKLRSTDKQPMTRKRSKSESNVSDCDLDEEEEEEESDSEVETDSEEEDDVDIDERLHSHSFVEELQHAPRQPSQHSSRPPSQQSPRRYKKDASQSPNRYKKAQQAKEKELAQTGAIPKKNRSHSFRQAVSDEDGGHSAGSSNSGTQLSLVAGTYRPPLVASHERSPIEQTQQPEFAIPSEETDDTESTGSESETASQLSLETVSYKPKSVVSTSTHDSGHHTLQGSSVSSDRRSQVPTRANMIAFQALTVNARPPPPLPAPGRSYGPSSTNSNRQSSTHSYEPSNGLSYGPMGGNSYGPPGANSSGAQPTISVSTERPYTPQFSPPVSPTSTASQPMSTYTVTSSRDGHSDGALTPLTEPISSENPSPTDSGKTPSTSSGVSSGDAPSVSNPSPIKYNVISPHTGQTHTHMYNPRSASSYQADLLKDVSNRNRTSDVREVAPPQYSQVYNHRIITAQGTFSSGQPIVRNSNNANNNAATHRPSDQTDSHRGVPSNPPNYKYDDHSTHAGRVSGGYSPQVSRSDGTISEGATRITSAGNVSMQTKSAASRLGVTPSLSGVRSSHNQGAPMNNHNAPLHHQGAQSYMHPSNYSHPHHQSTHPAGSEVGTGRQTAAITAGRGNMVPQQQQPTLQASHHQRHAAPSQPRTYVASSGNGQNVHRNYGPPPPTDPRGGSGSGPGTTGGNIARVSGAHNGSNGVDGGIIITDIEHFNKTAAPEQKLKYTREIIL